VHYDPGKFHQPGLHSSELKTAQLQPAQRQRALVRLPIVRVVRRLLVSNADRHSESVTGQVAGRSISAAPAAAGSLRLSLFWGRSASAVPTSTAKLSSGAGLHQGGRDFACCSPFGSASVGNSVGKPAAVARVAVRSGVFGVAGICVSSWLVSDALLASAVPFREPSACQQAERQIDSSARGGCCGRASVAVTLVDPCRVIL